MVFEQVVMYMWSLFSLWAQTLFILPFKNPNMLWILVPLWLSWFFGEFFQEKLGTSFGNAISNAVIVLWAGIDCVRQTLELMHNGEIVDLIAARFALCGVLIAYGILIIVYGTRTKEKVKRFGRIRDVTYAFAITVPVLYNAADLTWNHFLAALIFFPIFYYGIQLLDLKAPTPKALQRDLGETNSQQKIQQSSATQEARSNQPSNASMPSQAESSRQPPEYKRPPQMSYWNE